MSTVCDCEKKGVNGGTCNSSCSKPNESEFLRAGDNGTSDMVTPMAANAMGNVASSLIPFASCTLTRYKRDGRTLASIAMGCVAAFLIIYSVTTA